MIPVRIQKQENILKLYGGNEN